MQATLEANDPRALAAVSRQLPELWLSKAALQASQVATFAFIGERDELRPTVEAMIGVKPNLQVKVLPERDHITALMDPELVPAIRQFLLGNSMDVLRTPDDRFRSLPGYPFEPHYATVKGLRMHYVDEGPRHAALIRAPALPYPFTLPGKTPSM